MNAALLPSGPAVAGDAVAALGIGLRTLEVWPGRHHTLTRAEAAVVASTPFQRLRRLRQMGLAFHAWPNAENTRASHSLGVAYWAGAYLDSLGRASDPTTRSLLHGAADDLSGLSFGIVVRLYALLHDIDLLPLGHTLRYQSGAFAEPAGRPRLRACVAAIAASARDAAFLDAPDTASRETWLEAFEAHLGAAADILAGARSPAAKLIEEIVNSGLGADLVDFALRDSAAITRPQAQPQTLVDDLRLVETPDGPGLAVWAPTPQMEARSVAIADDLYRARFEVFAGSVYHPTKLAADAMLDFALRRLGAGIRDTLPDQVLIGLGDDQLMDALVEAEAAGRGGASSVSDALRAGVLHAEVWRTEDLAAFKTQPEAAAALALDPAWRTGAESALQARLPALATGDVIVAISPPAMQAKPANARIAGPHGVFALADAQSRGHRVAAAETAAGYAGLWSLRVCLAPRAMSHASAVREAAQSLFGSQGIVP